MWLLLVRLPKRTQATAASKIVNDPCANLLIFSSLVLFNISCVRCFSLQYDNATIYTVTQPADVCAQRDSCVSSWDGYRWALFCHKHCSSHNSRCVFWCFLLRCVRLLSTRLVLSICVVVARRFAARWPTFAYFFRILNTHMFIVLWNFGFCAL